MAFLENTFHARECDYFKILQSNSRYPHTWLSRTIGNFTRTRRNPNRNWRRKNIFSPSRLFNSRCTPSLGEFPKPVLPLRTHSQSRAASIRMKDGDRLQLCCEFECLTFHEKIWRFRTIYEVAKGRHTSDVWLRNYLHFTAVLNVYVRLCCIFTH